jgi:AraC-like DNA-binding protein
MQKRPFTKFVPKALSLKYPLTAGIGNFEIGPYHQEEVYHFHDCSEFLYCHAGKGIVSCEGQNYEFGAGDVIFISPYMPHYFYRIGEQSCRCEFIHVSLRKMFDPNIFEDITEFTGQLLVPFSVFPVISGEKYPVFQALIVMILQEMKSNEPYLEMSVKGYCMAVVAQLKKMWDIQRKEYKNGDRKASLYPALLYINRNYREDIQISELAKICGLSETHFRRLFKSKFAMSPLEYLNFIRIQEACILLSRNPILISQAAVSTGFRTLSSFNRDFRKVMGMTPSQWVKSLPEKDEKPLVMIL